MYMRTAKVLLISRDGRVREALGRLIRGRGHQLSLRPRFAGPIPPWLGQSWDAAFFDLSADGNQGLAAVALARQREPSLPITAIDRGGNSQGLDRLAQAVTLGAEEFMRKPIDRHDAEALLDRLHL
jgi:DNA-binding NtrC family response regulator